MKIDLYNLQDHHNNGKDQWTTSLQQHKAAHQRLCMEEHYTAVEVLKLGQEVEYGVHLLFSHNHVLEDTFFWVT
jgi:hypothetical protein